MVLVSRQDLNSILQSGVAGWNDFRMRHPGCVMLNGFCLTDAQLGGADLCRAFLIESDLRGINLHAAVLEKAILRKANLSRSDLRHCRLDGADLCLANLSGADLREASLASAFLQCTDLRGADLSTSIGLTDEQIAISRGDASTKLPEYLTRPASWAA
jgi:uncharacterized protein YjbI with pentapeptide repeats